MEELEWYEHRSEPMTVGRLKAVLEGLPDAMPVQVACPTTIDETAHEVIHAVSAGPSHTLYGPGERLVVTGSAPSGRYQRPRHGSVVVAGIPVEEAEETVSRLLDAVEEAVGRFGRGLSWSMARDVETGTLTWGFVLPGGSVGEVVDAAGDAAVATAPPAWSVGRRYVGEGCEPL